MYCKYCGADVAEEAVVCVHCGRRLKTSLGGLIKAGTALHVLERPKSPGLAAMLGFVLSCFFLGPVGYIYLGQWNWFWFTLGLSLLAWLLFVVPLVAFSPFFLILLALAYSPIPLVFAVHQYQMAKKLNRMREEPGGRGSS